MSGKINMDLFLNIFVISILLIINEQNEVLCVETFPEVEIPSGRLQGVYLKTPKNKIYEAYLGVPYAKPPFGDLRFKVAQPVTPWIGTYNASTYGADCLQFAHFGYKIVGSEDCLFLNIYKPFAEKKPDGSLFDVVVHFHGGAFMFYSPQGFKPDKLMDYDIVYVSVNYRLGPLGFMSTGDNVLPGNLGLKDQTFSLNWIKDNIKYFGGDPNKVTLTGVSAGGASVQYHYVSPLSRGLFHKGISASGTVLTPWALTIGVPEKTRLLASKLGCPTSDSEIMIQCLSQRPAEQIVGQVPLFLKWLYNPFTPFGPMIEPEGTDSPFLSRHPYDILEDGDFAQVPWMSSFTSEEGLYPAAEFAINQKLLEELEDNWNELAPHVLDYNYTVPSSELINEINNKIRKHYLKDKKITEGAKELIQMIGDRLFGAGIVQASLMQAAKSKSPVYMYRFAYRGHYSCSSAFSGSDDDLGVCHADDAGYIYEADLYKMEETEKDKKMGQRMKHLFISFIQNGVPEFFNGKPIPTVNEALPKIRYLEILSPDSAVITTKCDLANQQFWSTIPLNEKLKLPKQPSVKNDEL